MTLTKPVPTIDHIVVVLVQTSHPANIGSAARAMKTMGLTQLRLVAPDDFPSARADWLAAGAQDILRSAKVYDTFEQSIADCQYVVGTSARLRGLPWPHLPPTEAAGLILSQISQGVQCALVFGREARGLTNDELRACHLHTLIPGNPDYSVLNMAQAVQVMCYELRTQWLLRQMPTEPYQDRLAMAYPNIEWDEPMATADAMTGLFEHLESALTSINFIQPHSRNKLWPRLHRLLQRHRLDSKEVAILRGLCTHLERMVKTDEAEQSKKLK